jgi:HAD superfamily hydrolase (TIGR01509 family)
MDRVASARVRGRLAPAFAAALLVVTTGCADPAVRRAEYVAEGNRLLEAGDAERARVEFLNALKQSYTMEISHQKCKPVFNHQYALSRLRTEGFGLAVCSNSVRQSVEAMMRLAALDTYLDLMVSNEDVTRGKPDPEMYLKAMAALGVAPDECLILEDNDHGIEAALASGGHLMKIGVPDDVTYSAIAARIAEVATG